MNDIDAWRDSLAAFVAEQLQIVLRQAPSVLLAVGLLAAGWFLAVSARGLTRRLALAANRLLERTFRHGVMANARLSGGATVLLSEVAFWVVIVLAVTIAARVAGLPIIAAWLGRIAAYLPSLLVGAGIILVGYALGALVGEQLAGAARAARTGQSVLIGRLVHGAIFVTALVIGLDQMGVDVTFLVALFAVATGAIFAGLSIAFALGARDYVSNLLGARAARRDLDVGGTVRIGDVEGEVLEITATHLALESDLGRTLVPARVMQIETVHVVTTSAAETSDDR